MQWNAALKILKLAVCVCDYGNELPCDDTNVLSEAVEEQMSFD